jgi:hypothetical protein
MQQHNIMVIKNQTTKITKTPSKHSGDKKLTIGYLKIKSQWICVCV